MSGKGFGGAGLLGGILRFFSRIKREAPLRRASFAVAEALEARQLLSLTAAEAQHFRYAWNHLGPYARQDIAAAEYADASFAAKLDADVTALGLTPIAPQAPVDSMAPADGKSRRAHHAHRAHKPGGFAAHLAQRMHPKPRPGLHRHGSSRKGMPPYAGPSVTSANYYDNTLPQQITFTFSENVSPIAGQTWQTAFELLNLNTCVPIPITAATYNAASQSVTFSFAPGVAPADGNYVAILHGNQIADASGTPLLGSDNTPSDDYVWGAPSATLPYGLFFFDTDFNGDRSVNGADLSIMSGNYNQPGNYAHGDANYDGQVNFFDLSILGQRYNKSLPQLAAPPLVWFGGSTRTRIDVGWQASSDPAVTRYDVYRDGELVGSNVSGTNYLDGGLPAGTSHVYMVVAKDSTGNTSYPSAEVTGYTPAATPLTVYPLADQTVVENVPFTVSASFTDTGPLTTHTASISWGDYSPDTPATVTESNNSGTLSAAHVYSTPGTYRIHVTVSDSSGVGIEMFNLTVADAPLTATAADVQATQNTPFSGVVADLVDADTNPGGGNYTALINWGDGSAASAGTIVDNTNGDFTVTGAHTFATTGVFSTTVIVQDVGGSSATVSASADVTPPLPQPPSSLVATAASNQEIDLSWSPDPSGNSAGYNVYRSTDPNLTASDENLIDFGIAATTYQDTGLDSATTYYYLVTSANAASAESEPSNLASAATAPAQLSATAVTITPTEGEDFSGAAATFTDTDASADASNYTAQIDWGDGSATSDGTIQPDPSGGFDVTGTHAYKQYGTNSISVTITAADGRTATATSTANVQDAAIVAEGETTEGQGAFRGIVATFVDDDDADAQPSDFIATINWGNGDSSKGTVQLTATGEFSVSGAEGYTPGDYTATVAIADTGGNTASCTTVIHMPLPLSSGAIIGNGTLDVSPTQGGTLDTGYPDGLELVQSGAKGGAEGFGAADATTGAAGYTDGAGPGWPTGIDDLTLTADDTTASWAGTIPGVGEVTRHFHPVYSNGSLVPGLYAVGVSIDNTTGGPIQLKYRQLFSGSLAAPDGLAHPREGLFVSMHVGDSQVTAFGSNGADANPLSTTTTSGQSTWNGSVVDAAAGGWYVLDLDFGSLPAGAAQVFTMYLGAADDESQAVAYLGSAGINTYGTVQPAGVDQDDDYDYYWVTGASDNDADDQPDPSAPTLIFGFKPGPQISADLGIDANNDGAITPADDAIQDAPNLPGKVIVANTLDEGGHNKPGYADFDTSSSLSKMPVSLTNIDTSKAQVRFEYSAADPSLVTSVNVPGSDIPKYDPGSTGYLRLWTLSGETGARKPASAVNGGDYIPPDTAIPISDIISSGENGAVYVEGINPTDPKNTEVQIEVDPTGTGDWTVLDAARFTVGTVRLVYTDVSGISHDTGDTFDVLGVPRIAPTLQPDGVAADWKSGVDDGSMLLVSAIGSPAVAALANNATAPLTVTWGDAIAPSTDLFPLDPNDGSLQALDSGLVANAAGKLGTLGIAAVGDPWQDTGMTVLGSEYYRPPDEFDAAKGTADARTYRRIAVAVDLTTSAGQVVEGAKPEGMMLTRPPLVLVHGINSGPQVWLDKSGGTSFYSAATGAGYPTLFMVDHSGPDPSNPLAGRTYGEGEITDMYKSVEDKIGQATAIYRGGFYFPADPYAVPAPNQPATGGALIAVQKVDIVAHSYGGLLARWYVEQSPEYASRRDVRDLIELDTPNLGSPLANMVTEALTTDDPLGLGNLIGTSHAYGLLSYTWTFAKSG